MNRLKKVLLTGAALITLSGGILGACKRDYDTTPIDPTHIESPTNTPVPTIEAIVTPTPDKPTATPEATKVVPTSTPEATATPRTTLGTEYDERLIKVGYSSDTALQEVSKVKSPSQSPEVLSSKVAVIELPPTLLSFHLP